MAHPREEGPIRMMNREKERLGGGGYSQKD